MFMTNRTRTPGKPLDKNCNNTITISKPHIRKDPFYFLVGVANGFLIAFSVLYNTNLVTKSNENIIIDEAIRHVADYDSPLPTCDELMQRPFSPFSDGAFLTRKSTPVLWKMRQDRSREVFLPSSCRLKRYTAQQESQCLKNKSLLFVGDSVALFQFLSFAYLLDNKKWPKHFYSFSSLEKDVESNECAGGK